MKVYPKENNAYLEYKCPACGWHGIPVKVNVKEDNSWQWNGNLDKPTITPSVNHYYPESAYEQHPGLKRYRCHYIITDGIMNFCADCTHDKSGQSIIMVDYTDEEIKMREIKS